MYKNIVFDCGNVLIRYDRREMVSHFFKDEDEIDLMMDTFFKKWPMLDEGISTIDFYNYVKCDYPEKMHKNIYRFLTEWIYYFYEIDGMYDFLLSLKKNHKIYLLSNMPILLVEHMDEFRILKIFDGIVFSSPIKMVKPNRDIYEYLFSKYDLNSKECLFVDDHMENIVASEDLGMDGFLFNLHDKEILNKLLDVINK